MSLTFYNEDVMQHIVHFLNPSDFYSLKQVIPTLDDGIFWWDRSIALQTAVIAGNSSLVHWILRNHTFHPNDVCQMVHLTNNAFIHKAIYSLFIEVWPKELPILIDAFISHGCNSIFKYLISRDTSVVTQDTCDAVYLHSKWIMLSAIFVKAPKQFIMYVFGNYKHAADPEVILNLRFVLLYLYPSERAMLSAILIKYHEWLWSKKVYSPNALATIVAIHKLEILKFLPQNYVQRAIGSPVPDYLEYLIFQNLEIEPRMFLMTRDIDKLKLLYNAQTVQKYQKIMIMLLILISVIVGNLFFRHDSKSLKIESVTTIKHNVDERTAKTSQTIFHPEETSGWRFGISSDPKIY